MKITQLKTVCPREAQTCALPLCATVTLTVKCDFKTQRYMDILKMYPHIKNNVSASRHSQFKAKTEKYENSSYVSRSVTSSVHHETSSQVMTTFHQ